MSWVDGRRRGSWGSLPGASALRDTGRLAQAVLTPVTDWLQPRCCALCDDRLGLGEPGLCPGCLGQLTGRRVRRCPVCALARDAPFREQDDDVPCPTCQEAPPTFDASFALADYAAPLDRALVAAKFNGKWPLLGQLASVMAADLRDHRWPGGMAAPSVLLPVPLSFERLNERGYNQAEQITRSLSRRLGWPCDSHRLRRIRHTVAQSVLNRMDREANLRDAFDCRRRVDGQIVGLVDDVMTTGATLNAVARTVKLAGASRVICLVIARTPPPRIPATSA